MRGGHHGAFCTFLAEVAHKYNIKIAAKLARTYGSLNTSQDQMLQLILTHEIYEEAIWISSQLEARLDEEELDEEKVEVSADDEDPAVPGVAPTNNEEDDVKRSPTDRLDYFQAWSHIREISFVWQASFLSKRVRVTRGEVLNLVCRMLDIETNPENRTRVLRELEFMSFGSMIEQDSGTLKRKFVGMCPESPKRRDFVRIFCDDPEDYCWAAEILMFIKITGFTI